MNQHAHHCHWTGNCLYPNPSSYAAHGPDHITLFEFLGRILGKALFEGITIHPQFSHFFLSFLRGEYNFLHQFSDLSTMDAQLYNNLMFLKTYEGDAEELCLTFAVANDDFGSNKELALIPNGAEVPVTNSNKHRYIGKHLYCTEYCPRARKHINCSRHSILLILCIRFRSGCEASCMRSGESPVRSLPSWTLGSD